MNQQQIQTGSGVRMKTKIGFKEPKKYRVFIYDDDLTPIEFVYDVLKTIFFKNEIEAQDIADKAQQNGNTVVGEYTLDTARSRVVKATEMARMMNYPLKLEIENNGKD